MNTPRLLPAALFSLLAVATPALRAQTIPNPGFEADHFSVWPGYAGDNGGITGWTVSSNVGLNPAGGSSPFADNGAIPQGGNAAFLQSSGMIFSTLDTTIIGLTPGTAYTVRFRANMRSGYAAPTPGLSLNGGLIYFFSATPAVGGTNGYYYISGTFTATAATARLLISNQSPTDTTLLVDDFTVAPAAVSTSAWAVSPWTNDATSGISFPQTQWAYRFGTFGITGVNSTTVTGAGPNAAVPGKFAIAGVPETMDGDTNTLTAAGGSGSADVATSFIYGGNPATVTLEGLAPGHTYVVSLLSVGWDPALPRLVTFSSGGQQQVVDQDMFGDNNGLRVDYTFVADAVTRIITVTPRDSGYTFHFYGLALREPILITNTADSGTGSLRRAFDIAAAQSGPDFIEFDPSLSGRTIIFNSEIETIDQGGVTVDASTLPGGLILGNSGDNRHFDTGTGTNLTLRRLTLVNGGSTSSTGNGGAIKCLGTLTLTECTLSGSSTGPSRGGGAIYNDGGTLTLTNCTLTGNSAGNGGALNNYGGTLMLTDCTLGGNWTGGSGGAIYNDGTLAVTRGKENTPGTVADGVRLLASG